MDFLENFLEYDDNVAVYDVGLGKLVSGSFIGLSNEELVVSTARGICWYPRKFVVKVGE